MGARTFAKVAGVVTVGFLLTAASCERRGTRDAPINAALQDNQAPYIVNGPDGYANLALKCAGGDLVIVHTREAAPAVVPDASLCAPGVAEKVGIPRIADYKPEAGQ